MSRGIAYSYSLLLAESLLVFNSVICADVIDNDDIITLDVLFDTKNESLLQDLADMKFYYGLVYTIICDTDLMTKCIMVVNYNM